MVAQTLTKTDIPGNVVKEYVSNEYSLVSAVIKNSFAGAVVLSNFEIAGQPVVYANGTAELCESANVAGIGETDANGIVVSKEVIASLANAASTVNKYLILVRGPAVIWTNGIPAADAAGTAWDTIAEIVTALAALSPPIIAKAGGSPLSTLQTGELPSA